MGLFPTDDPAYAAIYAEEAAMVDAAELIADALDAANISQADLARRLGVSRSEITARLRGERNITVRKLAATLHALGVALSVSAMEPEPKVAPARQATRWAPPARIHAEEDHQAVHSRKNWALAGASR